MLRAALRALAWNVTTLPCVQKLTIESASGEPASCPATLGKLEAGDGDPTVATLVKVAVALGGDICDLFAPVGR